MNVTVGKYIPGDSIIHKMDPRIKLGTNIIFIVLVFLTKNFIMQSILFVPILLSFFASKLPKKQIIKMLIPVFFIGLFIFLVNLYVLSPKKHDDLNIYASWWKFYVSDQALERTLLIMLRIYIMIMITTLLTATTMPPALTRAIEDFLLPLKLFFVPIHIIAMIISIALRFIPTLLEEAQRIMKAQASRGVDFKNGNIKSKSKSMVTLIIPLFVSAFAKAEDLGNAMEIRGYDPHEKRTRYRAYPIKSIDIFAVLALVGLIASIVLFREGIFSLPDWK